jgi:hypothetical protein
MRSIDRRGDDADKLTTPSFIGTTWNAVASSRAAAAISEFSKQVSNHRVIKPVMKHAREKVPTYIKNLRNRTGAIIEAGTQAAGNQAKIITAMLPGFKGQEFTPGGATNG